MKSGGVYCDGKFKGPSGGSAAGWRMVSEVHVYDDGLCMGRTHTWSAVKLTGFHGGVQAQLWAPPDASGRQAKIADGKMFIYGVDGVWIGNHDRWDTWFTPFSADQVAAAQNITICHSWQPDWLSSIANAVKFLSDLWDKLNKGNGTGGRGD